MNAAHIRTKAEEVLIQTGTMEEQEWFFVAKENERHVNYAKSVAKVILGGLTRRYTQNGKATEGLAQDRAYLWQLAGVYQVQEEHRKLVVDLVTRCFPRRIGG